jgi:DNA-binding beta-propeller fold protein YncE
MIASNSPSGERLISPRISRALLGLLAVLALLALPAAASAAKPSSGSGGSGRHPVAPRSTKLGSLVQLPGSQGCLADGAAKGAVRCGHARALKGPGPFMGSRAVAVSPDGRNVYVAAAKSDAIAVFHRNRATGALRQPKGKAGCVAAPVATKKSGEGCDIALGLIGPNSIAVSPDGKYVYATSREGASLTSFRRTKTGALKQLPPSSAGCISGLPIPGCTPGRALSGPDVIVVSADGANVYVGSFFGNAIASFARNPESGALTQLEGTAGCIAVATSGCAAGIALGSIEGLAISPGGATVYAAAAVSNAVDVLSRNPLTGALSQATTTGTGCIADATTTGCTTGLQLAGANAVATAASGNYVYATSLFSNSVTSFRPTEGVTGLTQKPGASGCLIYLRAAACSFGRAMEAPEGLAVSSEGLNVYVASYVTGAIDILDRNPETGTVAQKPGAAGCLAPQTLPGCSPGRALGGVSSVAVSPDGRNVYATASTSNAVDVFRRIK